MSGSPAPGNLASSDLAPGDEVAVRAVFPPGHVRTPFFVRGKSGHIVEVLGAFPNPEDLAYGRRDGTTRTLYRVRFRQSDIWEGYDGSPDDGLIADIYDHWLAPTKEQP